MQLENPTPLPAVWLRSGHGDEMLNLLVAAITLDLSAGVPLLARTQCPLMLAPDPMYANDAQFLRVGVSVCAQGYVYAPGGKAKTGATELKAGKLHRKLKAFGPRVWWKAPGGTAPTDPRPFERIEMLWDHAFGGAVMKAPLVLRHEGEDMFVPACEDAYILNTEGTGYYPEESVAIDGPLPMIEDAGQLIHRWGDRPLPGCFAPYPLAGGLRAASMVQDRKVHVERAADVLGRACPQTTVDEVLAGEEIALTGMRPDDGVISLALPEAPVIFDVRVGAVHKRVTPVLEAIDIEAEAQLVRLVYRSTFRYPIIAEELRRVAVEPSAMLQALGIGDARPQLSLGAFPFMIEPSKPPGDPNAP